MPIDFRARHPVPAILAVTVILALAGNAQAHFLFVRIGPVAEGGRSAEVYFSELAKAGDPRFIPKIAHTKLWAQTKPGEFRQLEVHAGADRLRAILPSSRSLGVVGECEYGILSRPKQPPFLLRHYPKAIDGTIEEVNRLKRRPEIRFEIEAKVDQSDTGRIRLTAFREGKPMPGIIFHAVAEDLTETKITADSDGSIAWSPPASGAYCFYVGDTVKQSGELDGKRYEEIREFATLWLQWPIGGSKPDREASELFRKAIAKRAQWRHFPGFSADIQGDLDGRTFSGKITIAATGSVELEVDDDAVTPWIRNQVDSLITHRLPSTQGGASQTGSNGFTLRFGDQPDAHPLGRLLLVHGGQMASSYRIREGEIKVVNRDLGKQAMTLTVLDNETNRDGLSLPRNYVVQYWDAGTGRLAKAETFQDRWARLEAWDLPASHMVTTATDGGLSVRTIRFSGHALSKKP